MGLRVRFQHCKIGKTPNSLNPSKNSPRSARLVKSGVGDRNSSRQGLRLLIEMTSTEMAITQLAQLHRGTVN